MEHFRVSENSPAIDRGQRLSDDWPDSVTVTDGRPDVGAYEYNGTSPLYGDVSGNGEISAYDASLAAMYSVGLTNLTTDQIQAADVSGNDMVSAYDAALIAMKVVNPNLVFPVEGG